MERPDFPTAADVLESRLERFDLEFNVAFPGRVQNYDPATQTADIVPLVRDPVPRPDGSGAYDFESLPVIPSVAILQPRTRGWFFALPVQDGDTVLCVCCDGDLGSWRRADGGLVSPRNLQRHHISHAVAVTGLFTHGQALRHKPDLVTSPQGSEDVAMLMGSDADGGTRVAFKHGGAMEITRGSSVALRLDADGTVHIGGAAGEFVALAPLVDAIVSSLKTAVSGWTPVSGDGGASLKAVIAAWSPPSVAAMKAKAT